MMHKLGFLIIGVMMCAYANSAVVPQKHDYDLSAVPPYDGELMQNARSTHDEKSREAIKKIVQQAIEKKPKRKAKKGSIKKEPQQNVKKDLKTALASLMQHNSLSQEIIEILERQLQDPDLQEKVVSITIKKMPTRDALALMSKSSGVALVIDSDVSGTVQDLRLDNIPLAAALHSILMSNEPRLTLIKDFGVWRVMKMQTAREMFAGMAAREREKDFKASIASIIYAKWNDALKSRIEKLWQGVTQTIQDKANVYLVFDDVNRKIFFKGRVNQVQEFERYLQEIDVKIPQIRIDARVVLADKNFEEALGFKWSGVYNRRASVKHFDFVGLGPVDTTSGNPPDVNTDFNDIAGWALNFIPSSIQNTLMKIPFVFGNNDMNTKRLALELNAAESRNEIETVLKPSLLVYNEEMAEILVGQELPHQVRLDETIESRLTNVTTVNYKDVGMKIRVKPVVTPDHNAVFLDVYVENSLISRPEFGLVQGDDVGNKNSVFNYTIKTSRSQNRVLLQSGQTTMIGGLITNSRSKDKTGVPGLQDIPVIGWLFRGSRRATSDQQLLIFITPTLVT